MSVVAIATAVAPVRPAVKGRPGGDATKGVRVASVVARPGPKERALVVKAARDQVFAGVIGRISAVPSPANPCRCRRLT